MFFNDGIWRTKTPSDYTSVYYNYKKLFVYIDNNELPFYRVLVKGEHFSQVAQFFTSCFS